MRLAVSPVMNKSPGLNLTTSRLCSGSRHLTHGTLTSPSKSLWMGKITCDLTRRVSRRSTCSFAKAKLKTFTLGMRTWPMSTSKNPKSQGSRANRVSQSLSAVTTLWILWKQRKMGFSTFYLRLVVFIPASARFSLWSVSTSGRVFTDSIWSTLFSGGPRHGSMIPFSLRLIWHREE